MEYDSGHRFTSAHRNWHHYDWLPNYHPCWKIHLRYGCWCLHRLCPQIHQWNCSNWVQRAIRSIRTVHVHSRYFPGCLDGNPNPGRCRKLAFRQFLSSAILENHMGCSCYFHFHSSRTDAYYLQIRHTNDIEAKLRLWQPDSSPIQNLYQGACENENGRNCCTKPRRGGQREVRTLIKRNLLWPSD